MKHLNPKYLLLTAFFFLFGSWDSFAQHTLEHSVFQSEQLLKSFRNDSAYVLSKALINSNLELASVDSSLLRRLLLVEATALERNRQDTLALKKLLTLRDLSQTANDWYVFSRTSLVLADLYEKNSQWAACRSELEKAKTAIDVHGIDSLLPYYGIRVSFYHHLLGDQDSSVYFAQQVLEEAPKFKQHLEEGVGFMLMGHLTHDDSYSESLNYRLRGIEKYKQIENYVGVSFLYLGLSELHGDYGHFQQALSNNDSSIHYALISIGLGYEDHPIDHMYKGRAQLLRKMGQLDSAFVYLEKGYQVENFRRSKSFEGKVIEISNKYENEKKEQKILHQSDTIAQYSKRGKLLFALLFIIFILSLILGYYFYRLRKAFAKTEEQTTKLERLNRVKNTLFTNVSHELRTPLTLILGPLNRIAENNSLSRDHQKLMDTAIDNTRRLQQLVSKLLDLRKLELGQAEMHLSKTNIHEFFETNCGYFGALAERKKVTFNLQIFVEQEAYAKIDREKWKQIIYNLLSNALEFTQTGGEIIATVKYRKQKFIFEVVNSGEEIPPDDLPHLFDRFYQTAQNETSKGGLGIGLALCKEYAVLFNGDISVTSKLGFTTFTVTTPIQIEILHDAQRPALKSQPKTTDLDRQMKLGSATEEAKSRNSDKNTVLIVEDTEQMQDYIRTILRSEYNVLVAQNGHQAMQLLETLHKRKDAQVDLIISDIMMPVMDGFELLKELKKSPDFRTIPIIMLTARAELDDRDLALRIGVDDYMTKPFIDAELLARIKTMIARGIERNKEISDQKLISVRKTTTVLSDEDERWLKEFEEYIYANTSNTMLNMPLLSKQFAMSESTLLRNLKRLTGLTPKKYILEIKLEKARRMLEEQPNLALDSVASSIGYKDGQSFSRSFKKRYGVSPSEHCASKH